MKVATRTIIIVLGAALVIDMTAENTITSPQLVVTRAKVTMPNSATNPDQEHDHNQGPILVIIESQETTMVTIFMMMTTGEGIRNTWPLLSLLQDQTVERSLLEPNLLLFNIKTGLLNQTPLQHPHKIMRSFLCICPNQTAMGSMCNQSCSSTFSRLL